MWFVIGGIIGILWWYLKSRSGIYINYKFYEQNLSLFVSMAMFGLSPIYYKSSRRIVWYARFCSGMCLIFVLINAVIYESAWYNTLKNIEIVVTFVFLIPMLKYIVQDK